MDVDASIGLAGDTAADRIHDAEHESTSVLGQLYRRKGIGRLTALAYSYHHVICFDYRVAVAEFRSVFHLDATAAQLLDELLTDEACMPTRTTSHDDEASWIDEMLAVVDDG